MKREGYSQTLKEVPEYYGTRELRQHLSSILDSVVREYRVVYAGNKVRGGAAAAILPAEVLPELVAPFTFSPEAQYDEPTRQYYVRIPEIMADGVGDTPEGTLEVLLDNVETLTEEFFERADVYMRYPEYRRMYPYFLKLSMAPGRTALAQTVGLDTLSWTRPGDADL